MRLTAEQYNALSPHDKRRLIIGATVDMRMSIIERPFTTEQAQDFLTDPIYNAAKRIASDYRFTS